MKKTIENIEAFCISPDSTLRQATSRIDSNGEGIVLVVDGEGRFLNTLSDGDIRRAILADLDLNMPVAKFLLRPKPMPHRTPLTAPAGTPDHVLLELMNQKVLRQIPLLDEAGRVVDMALLHKLVQTYELPMAAVVMAGGFGTRLRPLTENLPKPMLPIGDRPLLELIIEQLRDAGIRQVNLTTHYKGEIIAQHFGDGQKFGVEINYVQEHQPLGTVGALSLMETPRVPILVINGDIVTRVDFRAMLNFHQDHNADMTVAVRRYEIRVPYGVVETDGVTVTGISEKPAVQQFINAGIYLLTPEVCRFIPNGQPYDIPDLISRLLVEGQQVVCFPIREYWLDIGRLEDYQQAQADIQMKEV